MEKFSIVIVGGGFAGLSTALHICSQVDAPVLLIDKGKIGDPRKTSPFTFSDTVEKYGLTDAVLQRYNRYSCETPTGICAQFQYDNIPLVTIDYQKTCDILLSRAQKHGSIEVLENTSAVKFVNEKPLFHPSKHRITLSNSAKVACDVLVDASGIAFFALSQLGIHALPPLYSHAYGEVLAECKISDPNCMRLFAGREYGNGGGWLYPLGEKTARFGFATVTTSIDFPKAIAKQNFIRALNTFYPYNKMLEGSRTIRSEFGSIPLGPLKRLVYDGVMIVGDAGGQATPWYCEGMRPALEAGELCAATIVEAYRKRDFSRKRLEDYQRRWDSEHRKPYSLAVEFGLKSWFRNQEEWDSAIKFLATIRPEEMIARIRYNRC